MKFVCLISLFIIFASSVFAATDTEFKFDPQEFERSVDASEDEEFEFPGREDVPNDDFDFSEEEIGADTTDQFDFSEADLNKDIKSVPFQENPKLDPSTKIITTKNGKYIYHPNQEKGLYKISRSNEYHYKFKKTPVKGFFHMKFGRVDFSNFPTKSAATKFENIYNSTSLTTAFFEYDWSPFKKYKSLSLKVGGGISYKRGTGRFVNETISTPAQEKYTLMMFPVNVGATYKFKFKDDQLFLPYVTGAIDYNLLTEFRSGFSNFKYLGVLGSHFGGGVSLNLGWLEKASALELDKEFGINNAYLSFEARTMVSFKDDLDLSGLIFVAGLSFEY